MEAKLIKMMEGYIVSLTGDIDDIYAITNKELAEEHGFYYISLKNCEAIANGYDLDELAKTDADLRYNQPGEEDLWLTRVTGIEYGFNLALELLADKKFSEDALYDSIMLGVAYEDTGIQGVNNYTELKELVVRRNTQTEWQVEVVMDRIPADLAPGGWDVFPKLDADGCLILKRK